MTDGPGTTAPRRVAGLTTWRLARLHQRAHGLLADRLAAQGFRGYDYRLLAALEELGPASQADLGRLAGLDRSDTATTIDRLSGRDLVRRAPDPADRRRNVVTLTDDGAAALASLSTVVAEVQEELLAPLARADRERFVRALDALLG